MRRLNRRLAFALILFFAAVPGAAARADVIGTWTESPATPNLFYFDYEVTNLPDFDQVRAGLANCGRAYCVPASSMNMLAYAANHGFPEVLPGPGNWQNDLFAAQATAALDFIGTQKMNTNPSSGTQRGRWFFGLVGTGPIGFCDPPFPPCEGLLPRDKFVVTAQFLTGSYQPRMYAAAKSAILNRGLISLCHGWYTQLGTCNGRPLVVRENGHCISVQGVHGYWRKGTSMYGAQVTVRDPGSDEGKDEGATCDAVDPFGQSDWVWHSYGLALDNVQFDPFFCALPRELDRITFTGDEARRLVDAYLIIAPKGAYTFTDDEVLLVMPLGLGGAAEPVRNYSLPQPMTIVDAAVGPGLEAMFVIGDGKVHLFDPLLQELVPLDPEAVPLADPAALVFGRHRGLYVLDAGDLLCLDIDLPVPQEVGRVAPPSPCTDLVYLDLTDEVLLLSPADRVVLRYPSHLDAAPVSWSIPAGVPLAAAARMAAGPAGDLWLMDPASTEIIRLAPDFDGGFVPEGYALPFVLPPTDLDVDDAGHLVVSVAGELHELVIEAGTLVPVPDGVLSGMPAGPLVRVMKSRTNFDAALHATPAWDDVLEDPRPGLPDCAGDANDDGEVDVDDLVAVIVAWGTADAAADLDASGTVSVDDVVLVIVHWGPCPAVEPEAISDACETATLVTEGSIGFSTLEATTDGPDLPPVCDEGFGLAFGQDVWLLYVPSQSGSATVRTCNAADYDTRLAAYSGACEDAVLIGCNDDGVGCGLTSSMTIPVVTGQPVLLRVGGYGVATGIGTIEIVQP